MDFIPLSSDKLVETYLLQSINKLPKHLFCVVYYMVYRTVLLNLVLTPLGHWAHHGRLHAKHEERTYFFFTESFGAGTNNVPAINMK
jgi:hypothetical protein